WTPYLIDGARPDRFDLRALLRLRESLPHDAVDVDVRRKRVSRRIFPTQMTKRACFRIRDLSNREVQALRAPQRVLACNQDRRRTPKPLRVISNGAFDIDDTERDMKLAHGAALPDICYWYVRP